VAGSSVRTAVDNLWLADLTQMQATTRNAAGDQGGFQSVC
jgi:hypothetical protein